MCAGQPTLRTCVPWRHVWLDVEVCPLKYCWSNYYFWMLKTINQWDAIEWRILNHTCYLLTIITYLDNNVSLFIVHAPAPAPAPCSLKSWYQYYSYSTVELCSSKRHSTSSTTRSSPLLCWPIVPSAQFAFPATAEEFEGCVVVNLTSVPDIKAKDRILIGN